MTHKKVDDSQLLQLIIPIWYALTSPAINPDTRAQARVNPTDPFNLSTSSIRIKFNSIRIKFRERKL